MSKGRDIDYLFLTGRLRAREAKMLTREKLWEMIEARDFAVSAKILEEYGYGDISGLDSPEIEERLAKRRLDFFDELDRTVPDSEIVRAFRAGYDYHNAKVLVKAEWAGVDRDHIISQCGRFKPDALMDAYYAEDFRGFPEIFRGAVLEAKSMLARTSNPQLSDLILDKACFAELTEMSRKLKNQFFAGYVRLLIDSANLRIFVRASLTRRGAGFLSLALIPGGAVRSGDIASLLPSGEGLRVVFGKTILYDAAGLGVEAITGGSSAAAFEGACGNAVASYLKAAKMVGFGVEPAIAHIAAVEEEIKAIRLILAGYFAGIEPEEIKQRLSGCYV